MLQVTIKGKTSQLINIARRCFSFSVESIKESKSNDFYIHTLLSWKTCDNCVSFFNINFVP